MLARVGGPQAAPHFPITCRSLALKLLHLRLLVVAVALFTAQLAAAVPVDGRAADRPFLWPTAGRITQPFGCTGFWAEPSRGSCRHFHNGIDVANRRGTPIYAAAAGRIRFVGRDPWWHDGDWLILISNGSGFRTLYAHMKAEHLRGIRGGRHVRQGQLIGHMSDTGNATGVHLHWGVYRNGRPVDPERFLEPSARLKRH
jgi:murein DD-endopeptidase MepM/ murein hydrolase activator NlpD